MRRFVVFWFFVPLVFTVFLTLTACAPTIPLSTDGSANAPAQPAASSPTTEQETIIKELDSESGAIEEPDPPTEHAEPAAQDPVSTAEISPFDILHREVPADFNWKDLPIMPEISQQAIAIYQYGRQLGRDPQHTSVIGDCQAIPFVFLGRYGLGQYTLDPMDTYLDPMIQYFKTSFERKGNAVRGGFTAASILSQVQADPDLCIPGENPFECEWREHNPSIVFINLETWREEGTVERYEGYLSRIVEEAIQAGTLPILIMKADRAEGEEHIINPAMARVAYEYDIPIINFWRAVQYLENRGIDPEREGFHLSEAGYHRKELLALRTLWQVLESVNGLSAFLETPELPEETAAAPTAAPESGAGEAETAPDLSMLDFQCEASCVYFSLMSAPGGKVQPRGIYEMDPTLREPRLISEAGIDLQDISPDHQQFLVNRGSQLFLVDRQNQKTEFLLDSLYFFGGDAAYFTDSPGEMIVLIQNGNSQQVVRYDLFDHSTRTVSGVDDQPIRLIKNPQSEQAFWESGACSARDFCKVDGIWFADEETQTSQQLADRKNLVFSPSGSRLAFQDPAYEDEINYYHNPILLHEELPDGIRSRRFFSFPHPGGFRVHPEITEYAYSPDDSKLLVIQDEYSDYFEKSLGLHLYLEDLGLRMVFEYGEIEGNYGSLRPFALWSPDSASVALLLMNNSSEGVYQLEWFSKDILDRFSAIQHHGTLVEFSDYSYIGRAFWVGSPASSDE
ncbi:MAG: SGNH/GDSL hydrolase family protein [Anaerolineaceae bacterium]|nr:SGNH/GDSL hydrolase family protein [Anaerolineaceae bacterium]